jgi:hypothetical protein
MAESLKSKKWFSSSIRLLIFLVLGNTFFPSVVGADCTSCENCPNPIILYETRQMISGSNQVLRAINGKGPYEWTWNCQSGYCGNLSSTSSGEGTPVTYSAESGSNANCGNNPTITVMDSCSKTANTKISVSSYFFGIAAAKLEIHCEGVPQSQWCHGTQESWNCQGEQNCYENAGNCCGTGISCYPFNQNPACSEDWLLAYIREYMWCDCFPDGKPTTTNTVIDVRTPEMKAGGCCPATLEHCVNITSFNINSNSLNLSGGGKINFNGNFSARAGSTVTWKIFIGGKVINGTGSSVSAEWDGKDGEGKQAKPDKYTPILYVETTGGDCGDDSDSKAGQQITVDATDDRPCPQDGSTMVSTP